MNRVGHEGRGESVWLGFFIYTVLNDFIAALREPRRTRAGRPAIARSRGSSSRGSRQAWDGEWYRRGYYDDGRPLGSAQNDECEIDSISQSWAMLSGAVPRRFAERAMDAVRASPDRSRQSRILLLLTPPFDKSDQDPGYIKGYPPGIRENGGQYTHAAVWALMAIAKQGNGDEAAELFHMLNPINHTRTPSERDALSHRAVRARRRRLRAAAACGARRLELVYGIGGLAVSRRPREHPRPARAAAITFTIEPVRAVIVGSLRDRLEASTTTSYEIGVDESRSASGPAC